jgi:hypothetical protein
MHNVYANLAIYIYFLKVAPTEMVASLESLGNYTIFRFFKYIISYIVTPGNLKSYYI